MAHAWVLITAYLSGAVCIVLLTLTLGWIVVWKCVLAKMPFIQELFDLHPKHCHKDPIHEPPSLSYQQRYKAYRRKRQKGGDDAETANSTTSRHS
ncbi:unnamed protein product [Albugo candida]|uniref:Uncharacterized protein n=1 Tax=Albugo candida TaxID=65357 RepID=A0A024FVT9_9STRA|nr:unnamed protein product [Albugo candida]|eukprot:CCI10987.1 unnamed protein product [Albugo candida]